MFRVIEFMANFAELLNTHYHTFHLTLVKKNYSARINNYDRDDVFSFYLR